MTASYHILLLSVVVLILKYLSVPLPENHTIYTDHWIFVHYHKTGHDLARRLGQIFNGDPCSALVYHSFLRRIPIENQLKLLHGTNVAIVAAPDVQIPWDASFLNQSDGRLKMVHFVRDPFEMVLSAYLYHSQLSPPGKEAWLKYPAFNPCEVDLKQLQRFTEFVGNIYGDVHDFGALLSTVYSLCTDIYTQPGLGARGYTAALHKLSKEDGLILEAARSIINVRGGDILRMATNALFERDTPGNQTYRVFLPDFPVGNVSQFALSSYKLFSFLMTPSASKVNRFWDCVDVTTAVQRSLQLAYVSNSTIGSSNRSTHVTKDFISHEERVRLKRRLQFHRVLGPILSIVQKILLS